MNKREKYHFNIIPAAEGAEGCQVITQTAATLVNVIDGYRKDFRNVPGETYSIEKIDTQQVVKGSIDNVRAIAALWLITERRKNNRGIIQWTR